MILYYAAGGGLGHLTRMRAVVHTLGIDEPITLLAPPRFAHDRRVIGDIDLIPLTENLARDSGHYRQWLLQTIERVAPSRIIVDTFPAGILGELNALPLPEGLDLDLVARALRWDRYLPLLHRTTPRLATAWVVEHLPEEQWHYLKMHCRSFEKIKLTDPPSLVATDEILGSVGLQNSPFRLVVHSGSENEIMALIELAVASGASDGAESAILLIAPRRPAALPPEILHLDLYPATPLFPHAERIITACGFNLMRQTEPWREKHLFIPFERRYDDQQRRAEARAHILAH